MSEPIVVDLNQTESISDPFRSEASYAEKYKPQIVALNEQAKRNRPDEYAKGSNQQWELAQATKEFNVASGSKYRVEHQDLLSDEKQRLEAGRWLSEKEFVRKLESILGHRVFVHDAGMPGMRGLFVKMRGMERFPYREDLPLGINYICGIRVPYMSEWSVLTLDAHGLPSGEKRGWRAVLYSLIAAGAITEQEAHEEFGHPTLGENSIVYRQRLYFLRNHKNERFTTR